MPLTLEQRCILWADAHWPECHASMSKGDRTHYRQCLGAVVRRRTKANVAWLWGWIVADSKQVLELSPHIGRFEAQGYQIPPADQAWGDYCRMMRALCDGVPLPLGFMLEENQIVVDAPAKPSIVRPSTRTGRLSEAARPGLFV